MAKTNYQRVDEYHEAFWEHFKSDLQGYKTSKSVIQMPMDKPLPEALIRKIITFRKKENEEKGEKNK